MPVPTVTPDQPTKATKPNSPGRAPNVPGYNPMGWRRFWVFLFVLLLVNFVITSIVEAVSTPPSVTIPYDVFLNQVTAGNVVNITATGNSITGTTKKAVSGGRGNRARPTSSPSVRASRVTTSRHELIKNKVSILAEPPNPPTPLWETLLLGFGPALIIVFGIIYLMRRTRHSRAVVRRRRPWPLRSERSPPVRRRSARTRPSQMSPASMRSRRSWSRSSTFSRSPRSTRRLGGTVPKGVLLIGAPGTGKTLLARAVAGEAACRSSRSPRRSSSRRSSASARPAFAICSRRHALLRRRSCSSTSWMPSAGRDRRALRFGGNEEQEQTLNQILTEMDGFDPHEGVIVLAATNRADVLDAALLRPGRFDRRITVPVPRPARPPGDPRASTPGTSRLDPTSTSTSSRR